MSYWDSRAQKIVRWPDRPDSKPGWTLIDCGCSGGVEWGGEEPVECSFCRGSGRLSRHDASGTVALYPGGPIRYKVRART